MNLAEELHRVSVSAGELAVCWLGQAGFFLKDEQGRTLVLDPYLSNCGERIRGFKRLSPMLIEARDLRADYYVTTHIHFDHFDFEAIPIVAANDSHTVFVGPGSCIKELEALSIEKSRCLTLDRGQCHEAEGISLRATEADHGTMAPDAIGLVLKMGGHTLYFGGDTAYRSDIFEAVALEKPDFVALSVNGKFGNMDAKGGAQAAKLLGAPMAVPCHYWTFLEHGGNPAEFCRLLSETPQCHAVCFRQGEIKIIDTTNHFKEREEPAS